MSVNALKPTFRDREGYLAWRKSWKAVYRELSRRILLRKQATKSAQRHGDSVAAQKELYLMSRDATKMMTLLDEAKVLRDRILDMQKQIAEQPFPLEMDGDRVDLFFNKASIQYPVLPKWVLKTKGKSFYVDHIDADLPWNTRELDSGPTLGMIRFRKCQISISADRVATLRK